MERSVGVIKTYQQTGGAIDDVMNIDDAMNEAEAAVREIQRKLQILTDQTDNHLNFNPIPN